VVHRTGGSRIGPAINTFLNPAEIGNAHYLIDRNGHIIKMAKDSRAANQAGRSRWGGAIGLNSSSIGIEIVNGGGTFLNAQYLALIGLVQRLRTAYPTIAVHRIVGHSDIATTSATQPNLLSNRRAEDPGIEFDWERLENVGLGMRPVNVNLGNYYAGIFSGATTPAIVLRRNDRDAAGALAARLGGVDRPGLVGMPVRELQEDLEHIGYSARPVGGGFGTFDLHTERALDRFQRHFFSGTRKGQRAGRMGRLDALTANWIKSVRASVP
jgi:N-acetyl-anhydromuramyl-L-alanine amidase AmpD